MGDLQLFNLFHISCGTTKEQGSVSAQTKPVIFTLKQKDIGAIYLENAQGSFSINNASNEKLGRAVSTGIFLNENGKPGTVQQVNLYV